MDNKSPDRTYTVQQLIDSGGFGSFQQKLLFVTACTYAADACISIMLTFIVLRLDIVWRLSDVEAAMFTSTLFMGQFVGSLLSGFLADRFGRRKLVIIGVGIAFIFHLSTASSQDIAMYTAFLFFVGLGLSSNGASYALYHEYTPTHKRALYLTWIQVAWSVAAMLETFLCWVVFGMEEESWRLVVLYSALPLLLVLIFSQWFPPSASWLYQQGRRAETINTLERLMIENDMPMEPGELAELSFLDSSSLPAPSLLRQLFAPHLVRTTIVVWLLWFFQAFLYFSIAFVTPYLFASGNSYSFTLLTQMGEVPAVFLSAYLLDGFGRRHTMTLAYAIFSVCTGIIAAADSSDTLSIILLIITRFFVYINSNANFVYTTEVYGSECRATALGTSFSASRLGAVCGVLSVAMMRNSTDQMMAIIAMLSVLACGLTLVLVYEPNLGAHRPIDNPFDDEEYVEGRTLGGDSVLSTASAFHNHRPLRQSSSLRRDYNQTSNNNNNNNNHNHNHDNNNNNSNRSRSQPGIVASGPGEDSDNEEPDAWLLANNSL